MGFRGGNTPERLIQFDLVILNKSHADDFFFFLTNTFPEVYRSKFRHCCWCLSGLCTFFSGQSARSNIQLPLTQLANGVHAAECGSHPSRAPSVHCSISVCFLFRLCDILKDWHGSTRGCACVYIYKYIYIKVCACDRRRPCSCERSVSVVLMSDRPASLFPSRTPQNKTKKHLFRPRHVTEVLS